MHSLQELQALITQLEGKRSNVAQQKAYEYICFSCWDAFSLEGFSKMKDLGVTTMTTYPWMLYGVMNDAPLKEKIDGMERFFTEIVRQLR